MKVKIIKPEPIPPPVTYAVEFTEQEMIDLLALWPVIGGPEGYLGSHSGRKTWSTLSRNVSPIVLASAKRLRQQLKTEKVGNDFSIYYPSDGIVR